MGRRKDKVVGESFLSLIGDKFSPYTSLIVYVSSWPPNVSCRKILALPVIIHSTRRKFFGLQGLPGRFHGIYGLPTRNMHENCQLARNKMKAGRSFGRKTCTERS